MLPHPERHTVRYHFNGDPNLNHCSRNEAIMRDAPTSQWSPWWYGVNWCGPTPLPLGSMCGIFYLVVSINLKNISQIGSFPQVGVKKKCLKPPTSIWWWWLIIPQPNLFSWVLRPFFAWGEWIEIWGGGPFRFPWSHEPRSKMPTLLSMKSWLF